MRTFNGLLLGIIGVAALGNVLAGDFGVTIGKGHPGSSVLLAEYPGARVDYWAAGASKLRVEKSLDVYQPSLSPNDVAVLEKVAGKGRVRLVTRTESLGLDRLAKKGVQIVLLDGEGPNVSFAVGDESWLLLPLPTQSESNGIWASSSKLASSFADHFDSLYGAGKRFEGTTAQQDGSASKSNEPQKKDDDDTDVSTTGILFNETSKAFTV